MPPEQICLLEKLFTWPTSHSLEDEWRRRNAATKAVTDYCPVLEGGPLRGRPKRIAPSDGFDDSQTASRNAFIIHRYYYSSCLGLLHCEPYHVVVIPKLPGAIFLFYHKTKLPRCQFLSSTYPVSAQCASRSLIILILISFSFRQRDVECCNRFYVHFGWCEHT